MVHLLIDLIGGLAQLNQPSPGLAAALILATLVALIAAADWRVLLAGLALQYLWVGLLSRAVLDPRFVFVKLVVGFFVALILFVTGRQVDWSVNRSAEWPLWMRSAFAAAAVLLIWLVAGRSGSALPFTPAAFNAPLYALVVLGGWSAVAAREPFQAGVGLLLFLMGFQLFYSVLEQSLLVAAALAATHLLVAVSTAYLTLVRHQTPHPAP